MVINHEYVFLSFITSTLTWPLAMPIPRGSGPAFATGALTLVVWELERAELVPLGRLAIQAHNAPAFVVDCSTFPCTNSS